MTPLRHQMLDVMCQRGFSPQAQQNYIYAARSLAAYFGRSPARLSMQDLQQYFKVLAVERKLSASTCRLHLHSIRFLVALQKVVNGHSAATGKVWLSW